MGVTTSLAGVTKPASSGATEVASVSKVSSGGASFGLALESARRVLEAAGAGASATAGEDKKATGKAAKKGKEAKDGKAQALGREGESAKAEGKASPDASGAAKDSGKSNKNSALVAGSGAGVAAERCPTAQRWQEPSIRLCLRLRQRRCYASLAAACNHALNINIPPCRHDGPKKTSAQLPLFLLEASQEVWWCACTSPRPKRALA